MKIYSIVITIIALLALVFGGYFYLRYDNLSAGLKNCLEEKSFTESRLDFAKRQIDTMSKTAAVMRVAMSSFVVPGDLRALAVGGAADTSVEQRIEEIADETDRIMARETWNNFKASYLLNYLFGFLRNLTDNLQRTASHSDIGPQE